MERCRQANIKEMTKINHLFVCKCVEMLMYEVKRTENVT